MRFGIDDQKTVDHPSYVSRKSTTPTRLQSLKQLIDDPSPSVSEAVLNEILLLEQEGADFIKQLCTNENLVIRTRANEIALILEKTSPVGMFREFIQSLNYELETGFFLLGHIHSPNLEISECMALFDKMAARCQSLFTDPLSIRDKCRILNRVIFHEYGFTGNRSDYDNPENTFIQPLLTKRKGLPISLSIIYLLVAQRLEMILEPVGLPGKFMIGCFESEEPFYIDVFDNGVFRTFEELALSMEQNSIEPDIGFFTPCSTAEVLYRCCCNLRKQYRQAENTNKAGLFLSLMKEFEVHFENQSSN